MLTESFSGIRGIYNQDITKETIRQYSIAFAQFLKKSKEKPLVVIGGDTRPSTEEVRTEMKTTLLNEGVDIVDIGINTTPAIEHGVRVFKADGGIIITASHNEPEWNGWKLLTNNGSLLRPDEIEEVINNSRTAKPDNREKGTETNKEKELRKEYLDFVLNIVGKENIESIKNSNFKIVADPNGGSATPLLKDLFEAIGVEANYKNMELGVFKRLIEPNEKSLAYLALYVDELKADLGAGWDCDGDRVEIISDNGKILSGHYMLALLVDEILSNYKGENKTIVTNDATSTLVKETAKQFGADTIEVEVGEINVIEKMDELNSPMGGEGSSAGGIFPPSRCRDGILSLLIILRLMARKKQPLSKLLEQLPEYYTRQINLKCSPEKAKGLRTKLESYWKEQEHIEEIKKTGDETGGLKIIRKSTKEGPGWIWYRASKTESGVFRIISDAKSELYADKLLAMGEKAFNDCLTQ